MTKKFKIFSAIIAFAVGASAVVLSSVVASNPENGFLRRAYASQDPVSQGKIVFSSGTTSSGDVNTTIAYTQYGSPIVCKVTGNDTTQSSGVIGAVKSGSELRFYESDGVTEYLFEDVDIFKFTFSSGYNAYKLHGFYDSGEQFDFEYASKTTNPRSANFSDSSKYGNVAKAYVEFTNSSTINLLSLELTYNCESKSQTGVEISTAPAKTTYMVGQSFDPTDMIVKNLYSNGGKVATDSYTISPSGALSVSDTYVTITSNGFTVQQPITVSEAAPHAIGTYKNSSYYIELSSGGIGRNYCGTDTCDLSWTYDGSSLVLSAAQTYSFTGTIFHTNTSVTASTVTLDSSNDIYTFRASVKTAYGTSTVTFTRQ